VKRNQVKSERGNQDASEVIVYSSWADYPVYGFRVVSSGDWSSAGQLYDWFIVLGGGRCACVHCWFVIDHRGVEGQKTSYQTVLI